MDQSSSDNKTRGIRQLSARACCFRENLEKHRGCLRQRVRLSWDEMPLGHGTKLQALLIQFQASIAAQLWAGGNCVVVDVYVWMQAGTYSIDTKFFHVWGGKKKGSCSCILFHPKPEALNKKSFSAETWWEITLWFGVGVCARVYVCLAKTNGHLCHDGKMDKVFQKWPAGI